MWEAKKTGSLLVGGRGVRGNWNMLHNKTGTRHLSKNEGSEMFSDKEIGREKSDKTQMFVCDGIV